MTLKNNNHTDKKVGIRDQQKELTRKSILQSALSLFAERGFDGAVIRDIAAEAGVNHAMVKYHFVNKENLWKEAVSYLFERAAEEILIADDELTDLSTLQASELFIRKYVQYCAKHPEHAQIMVQASVRDNDRLKWAVDCFIKDRHKTWIDGIAQAQKEGVWPQSINPVYLLYITVSVSQTIFMLAPEVKRTHGTNVKSSTVVNDYADAIIELFFKHHVTA